MNLPSSLVAARQQALLAWYDRAARDLPWRRRPSLYGTWIAEMMLQQTTVATVNKRWSAFLERFPDLAALAAADEQQVLAAWSGLGYYRRARNLHAAARHLVAEAAGVLPRTLAGWRALPGIGDYAAGAIASIGLDLAVPAVDANVRRVLTRWSCASPEEAAALARPRLHDLAARHVPTDRPGDWNQALMDLGAGPCRSGPPDCAACPVRSWCAAGQAGTAALVPAPAAPATTIPVALSSLVLRHHGHVLLLPSEHAVVVPGAGGSRTVRADMSGLLTGLLALPSTPWHAVDQQTRGNIGGDAPDAAWRRWLRGLGWRVPVVTVVGQFRHAITVHRLRVVVLVANWPSVRPRPDVSGGVWMPASSADLPLATLARRAVEMATNDL